MDVHDKKTRSYNMSQVKNKNTKPEEIVRKFLFSKGFRYRKNVSKLQGKPDIVLPKYKTVIMVNGCFWHGHSNCKKATIPQTNSEFWLNKINGNVLRDQNNKLILENEGWKVLIVWECELNKNKRDITLENLVQNILQQNITS